MGRPGSLVHSRRGSYKPGLDCVVRSCCPRLCIKDATRHTSFCTAFYHCWQENLMQQMGCTASNFHIAVSAAIRMQPPIVPTCAVMLCESWFCLGAPVKRRTSTSGVICTSRPRSSVWEILWPLTDVLATECTMIKQSTRGTILN
jgi:hypothetical protein